MVELQCIHAKGTSELVSLSVSYQIDSHLGCRSSQRVVVKFPVISLNTEQTYKLQSEHQLTSWHPLYTIATAMYIQHIFHVLVMPCMCSTSQ